MNKKSTSRENEANRGINWSNVLKAIGIVVSATVAIITAKPELLDTIFGNGEMVQKTIEPPKDTPKIVRNEFNLPTIYDLCDNSNNKSIKQPILDNTLYIRIINDYLYVGGINRDSLEYAARTGEAEEIYAGHRDKEGVMNFELKKSPYIELSYKRKFYSLTSDERGRKLCFIKLTEIDKVTMALVPFPTDSNKLKIPPQTN